MRMGSDFIRNLNDPHASIMQMDIRMKIPQNRSRKKRENQSGAEEERKNSMILVC